MPAETIKSEYLSKHPYFTARRDGYRLSGGNVVDPYFVVELPPSVVAMAITQNREILLVRQYRYPVNEDLIELPGGFIDAGEEPQQSVSRELLEETGYSFSDFHFLGSAAANPGVLNNFTHFFLATGGKLTAGQQLDRNEQIEIMLMSLEEVREMLYRMEFKQSLHALCMFYAFRHIDANPGIIS